MRCIFCKNPSGNSKSVEHIFPESLGNKDNVLPKVIVCDGCNQYFASKIEKHVLDTPYFRSVRHRHDIASKKNKIPWEQAIIGGQVVIDKSREGRGIIVEDPRIAEGIVNGTITSMIVPHFTGPEPDDRLMARFIGKIGLEILASRVINEHEFLDEIIDHPDLDLIRNFVRYDKRPPLMWNYSQRQIYPEGAYFSNKSVSPEPYQVLHEATILRTEEGEYFAVVAIMGIEYALNLGGPELEGYTKWLAANERKSPLDIGDARVIVDHSPPDWRQGDMLSFWSAK